MAKKGRGDERNWDNDMTNSEDRPLPAVGVYWIDEKDYPALLQLFATHAGRPFSRTELCKRLNVALERSIDVQVTRLRRKIEEDPKLPLYLQTVRGVGYMLVPDRA